MREEERKSKSGKSEGKGKEETVTEGSLKDNGKPGKENKCLFARKSEEEKNKRKKPVEDAINKKCDN